jgi:hypothetical protein
MVYLLVLMLSPSYAELILLSLFNRQRPPSPEPFSNLPHEEDAGQSKLLEKKINIIYIYIFMQTLMDEKYPSNFETCKSL